MADSRAKAAHEALETLIAEIKEVGLSGRTRRNTGDTNALSNTAAQWLNTLERAAAEIPEWCDAFSPDVKPKS